MSNNFHIETSYEVVLIYFILSFLRTSIKHRFCEIPNDINNVNFTVVVFVVITGLTIIRQVYKCRSNVSSPENYIYYITSRKK